MSLRMAALATFIAALPLSVELPADSTARRGQTRFEASAGRGQYGIVTRGCNNEIVDVIDRELRTGALAVEHETASGVVIGVRAGRVRETQDDHTVFDPFGGSTTAVPGMSQTNRYVNPHVAFEQEEVGLGLGWLRSDHRFAFGGERRERIDVSGHLRVGPRDDAAVVIQLMEEVPLQTMGNVTVELALHPSPELDVAPVLGFHGPFDGTVLGVRGRVWLTPEAALHVRACFGGVEQYGLAAGLAARWPGGRRPQ